MRFDNVEAGVAQLRANRVLGPPVRRRDRARELLYERALEEPDKQCASRHDHAVELAQGNLDRVGLVVNECLPRQNPPDRIGASVDGIETVDCEVHGGKCICGMSSEFRQLIDAPSDQALLGQEFRPRTRPQPAPMRLPSTSPAHVDTICRSNNPGQLTQVSVEIPMGATLVEKPSRVLSTQAARALRDSSFAIWRTDGALAGTESTA